MAKRLLIVLALFAACLQVSAGSDRKFILVIDAGHGGKDTGAPGSFSKEKNINLDVALAFGRYVENNNPDVKVVYTRKTDVFVPLYERAEIANRNKADLFISVHTNALVGNHTARGFESYTLGDGRSQATKTNLEVAKRENSVILMEEGYQQHYVGYDPNSPESNIMFEFVQDKNLSKSVDLAKMMQKHVCQTASRPNRGVHQSNLAVLRLASMPACLIELGYISTPAEEQLLNDKDGRERLAMGIYNAFAEYKNKYYSGMVSPYRTEAPILSSPQPESTEQDSKAQADTDNEATEKQQEPRRDTQRRQRQDSGENSKRKTSPSETADKPVFKVQIIASDRRLKQGDRALKGLEGCESYEEGGMVKYTYGASTDYNEVYRTRKQILDKFPGAFIIAFKNGEKMNVNEAIREFKRNKK